MTKHWQAGNCSKIDNNHLRIFDIDNKTHHKKRCEYSIDRTRVATMQINSNRTWKTTRKLSKKNKNMFVRKCRITNSRQQTTNIRTRSVSLVLHISSYSLCSTFLPILTISLVSWDFFGAQIFLPLFTCNTLFYFYLFRLNKKETRNRIKIKSTCIQTLWMLKKIQWQ